MIHDFDGVSGILGKYPSAPLQESNIRLRGSQAMIHDFDGVSGILGKYPSAPL